MLTSPRHPAHRRLRGFSMLELFITLVVLGFTLAVGLPNVADWLRDLRLRGVAESLKTGLDKARMEALKGNRTISYWLVTDSKSKVPGADCVLSATGLSWVVSVKDPSGACQKDPSTTDDPMLAFRSEAALEAGMVTSAATAADGNAATQVTFNALGQVQGAGAIRQIVVSRADGKGRTLRIMIEPGGSVRTCDPKVSAADPRACP
jgi:type IV fimbrial biogenesis protein FimT